MSIQKPSFTKELATLVESGNLEAAQQLIKSRPPQKKSQRSSQPQSVEMVPTKPRKYSPKGITTSDLTKLIKAMNTKSQGEDADVVYKKQYNDDRTALDKDINDVRYKAKNARAFMNSLNRATVTKLVSYYKGLAPFKDLDRVEIEFLIVEDDLGSIWKSIKTGAGKAWDFIQQQGDAIKPVVKSLLDKGVDTLSALLPEAAPLSNVVKTGLSKIVDYTFEPTNSITSMPTQQMSGFQSKGRMNGGDPAWSMKPSMPLTGQKYCKANDVNMDYVAGSLSKSKMVNLHPEDAPGRYFFAQQSTQITLTANALGNIGFALFPYDIFGIVNQGTSYYKVSDATYTPATTTSTAFTDFAGPLLAAAGNFESYRVMKTVIEIIPSSAANFNGGTITTCVAENSTVNPTLGGGITAFPSLNQMLTFNSVEVTNLAQTQHKQLFLYTNTDNDWQPLPISITQTPGLSIGNLNAFYLCGSGLSNTASGNPATITVVITYGWAAELSQTGMQFMTGVSPGLGASQTEAFINFLRQAFPAIMHWKGEDVDRLFTSLLSHSYDYDTLVEAVLEYQSGVESHKIRRHLPSMESSRHGEDMIMDLE